MNIIKSAKISRFLLKSVRDFNEFHTPRLEWIPEEASLLQDRPSLLQRLSTTQGNMGDSEPPDNLYETCVLVSFTLCCMSIIIETLHDQYFSQESLRDSKPPVIGYPRTKGQEF